MTSKTQNKFNTKSKAEVMIKGSVESKPLAKLIKSAAANAVVSDSATNLASLYVSKIWAAKKMELRRMKAGPKGRGRPIRKRYSQVYVELGVKEG
jgi:ribosomal protein L22